MATVTLNLNVAAEKSLFNFVRGMVVVGTCDAQTADRVYAAAAYAIVHHINLGQNAETKNLMNSVNLPYTRKSVEMAVLATNAYTQCIHAQQFGSIYAA